MKAPVFVLGCPRSGTTLLYHMLLSAGGFAVYRAETHVFDWILPRFGSLGTLKQRHRLMDKWLLSRYFQRSGLGAADLREKVLFHCNGGGDFIRIVMEGIAKAQNVDRWADCTPAHALHIPEIKRSLPDALFIHMIRDGRDVALSLDKTGWISPFPWSRKKSLAVAILYWQWIVTKAREYGRAIAPDYIEVHFEDLVQNPHDTLARLSIFLDHDLDYDRIQRVSIGSVRDPNTSFTDDPLTPGFDPVGRWRKKLSEEDIAALEGLAGDRLAELGYPLVTPNLQSSRNLKLEQMKLVYRTYSSAKQWLKMKTPLSRFLADIDEHLQQNSGL